MSDNAEPRRPWVEGADASGEPTASWVRRAATQVKVRPGATAWTGTLAQIVRDRRRRANRRAGLVGVATLLVVVAAVLGTQLIDSGSDPAGTPAGAGAPTRPPQPAVPADVLGPSGNSIKIDLVDTPQAVPLTDSDRATVAAKCEPRLMFAPGNTTHVLGAVRDKQGVTAIVATETGIGLCSIPAGAGGGLDFDRAFIVAANAAPGYKQYLLPPASTLATLNLRANGPTETGRVSADVAMVLAVYPTGQSMVVPILDNGMFYARFADETQGLPGSDVYMTFYAFDAGGRLLARLTDSLVVTDDPARGLSTTSHRPLMDETACLTAARHAPRPPADLPTGQIALQGQVFPPAVPQGDGLVTVNVPNMTITCTGPADAFGWPDPARLTFRAAGAGGPL